MKSSQRNNSTTTRGKKMISVKNTINKVFTSMFLFFVTVNYAIATEVKAPSWVKKADKNSVSEAGEEINMWIFVFMVVIIALFSIKPGYYFIVGKTEEGLEAAKNILIGAVLAVILGGIAFAVVGKF
jgi:hypothetical protein